MGIRDFLRKKRPLRPSRQPVSRAIPPPDDGGPKNGRLTLAVIASVLLMIPLAGLNVRLILDPSIAGKAFGSPAVQPPATQDTSAASLKCAVPGKQSAEHPPEATFYTRLSAQEEHQRNTESPENAPITETSHHKNPGHTAAGTHNKTSNSTLVGTHNHPAAKPVAVSPPPPSVEVPAKTDTGPKTYMVQVGTFSHPRIAQQWALNWKSRGFDVVLKPVARPGNGVTYRLYLGKFESQKDADALVKKLKAKEGISALTLLSRD